MWYSPKSWKRVLLRSAITILSFLVGAQSWGQDLLGLHVGDPASRISTLGMPPTLQEKSGPYSFLKWSLDNSNDLSVTVDKNSTIVFIESDWGRKPTGVDAGILDFKFGTTTLSDIRSKFGNNGISFVRGSPAEVIDGGVALLNSYHLKDIYVTFVTKISNVDFKKINGDANLVSKFAVLDSFMYFSREYARTMFGEER